MNNRKEIDLEILKKEYIDENMSLKELAKKYDRSESGMYKILLTNGIKKDKNKISEKRKKYNLEKYGCENPFQRQDVKDKIKQTNLEKYGVDNPYKNEEVKNKYKQTCLERYGVDNPSKNREIRNKVKQTSLKRYGVDNPSKSDEIKNKIKETCIQKYGGVAPACNSDIHEKMEITNMERYGVRHSMQSSDIKEKLKKTNLERYGVEYILTNPLRDVFLKDRETFISFISETFEEKPTRYDIAEVLNYSPASVSKYIHLFNAEDYVNMYPKNYFEEDEIINILESFGITNYVRSERNILDGKEIDIYLPDYKVGIEFNGSYWHSEKNKSDKKYHYNKSKVSEENDVFIYHIFGYEWENELKKEKIINQLKNILGLNENKIYARKCEIKVVDKDDKIKFINENHIQGNDNSKIHLGLYYNNELVSIMTFVKPRFNKNHNWELSRYCSKSNTTVVGGASKLFKHFVNNYMNSEETILSYSDIAKTKGNLYETLGFKLDHISDPNYIWWKKDTDFKTRYQCQMKNEVQIMHDNGYYRIYDCGNKVWIYTKNRSE